MAYPFGSRHVNVNSLFAVVHASRRASIHVEVLAEVLGQLQADQFDLLAHVAFDRPVQDLTKQNFCIK